MLETPRVSSTTYSFPMTLTPVLKQPFRDQIFNDRPASGELIGGTYRCCSPTETFRRMESHFIQFEITRVANITGLDRIGIPVWLTMPPKLTIAVAFPGKGADS